MLTTHFHLGPEARRDWSCTSTRRPTFMLCCQQCLFPPFPPRNSSSFMAEWVVCTCIVMGQDSLVSIVICYGLDDRVQFLAGTNFSICHHMKPISGAHLTSCFVIKKLHLVPRLRMCCCKDNIETDLREMEWRGVYRIQLPQDRAHWLAVVSMVINDQVLWKVRESLTSRVTIIFSGRTASQSGIMTVQLCSTLK